MGERRDRFRDISPGLDGQYIYTGTLFRYAGESPRKTGLLVQWLLLGAGTLCLVIAGMLPAPGMQGGWYVSVPYVLCLISAAAQLWALGRVAMAGDPIRRYVYEGPCQRLPRLAVLSIVLCGVVLLGEALFLFLHGTGGKGRAAAAFLCMTGAAGGLFLLGRRRMVRFRWEPEEADSRRE